MFSVYGLTGQTFHGPLEQLTQVLPVRGTARLRKIAAIGREPDWQQQAHSSGLLLPSVQPLPQREAIASYVQTLQAEQSRQPLSRVEDLMSRPVVSTTLATRLLDGWHLLATQHVGQVPVLSETGHPVGLLQRADLLQLDHLPGPEIDPQVWRAFLLRQVADVTTTPLPCVAAATDIRRVARVLLATGLPGLPVVTDGGQLCGFISRTDILRAVVTDPPLDLWG